MPVELVPVTLTERPCLENLLELYIHDLSAIVDLYPGDDGRFGYPGLERYWNEPGRFPYFIRADQRLAGLALVSRGSRISGDPNVYDMAEFFVVRALRRSQVGSAAAHSLFAMFPGRWEVRVMERNTGAQLFWERAVGSFTGGRFATSMWQAPSGRSFCVLSFERAGG